MSSLSTGARDQVARLLTLVPYLHAHGDVRLDDAARALGVSENTLVKDLRVLYLCGLPGGYPDDLIDVDIESLVDPEGDRVIRVSNADYLARPLRLTPTEATAVIVALRALRAGSTTAETADVVDRALAKLEYAAAEGAAPTVDPGDESVDPGLSALRRRLEDAVSRARQVRLTYWVPARDETSERVVDPRAVVSLHGSDYLDAWCHSAEAPRSFRLDRIDAATVLDTPVETAPEGPSALADGLFTQADDVRTVTLRLEPEARWVAEYYPVTATRTGSDGSLEVDLVVADPRWLARLLLRVAPYATVLDAPGREPFIRSFRETVVATLGLYAEDA